MSEWTQLPDNECDRDCLAFKHTRFGYVTVDLRRRIFSIGLGLPRSHITSVGYTGRGWKERLIQDAKNHLERIWDAA